MRIRTSLSVSRSSTGRHLCRQLLAMPHPRLKRHDRSIGAAMLNLQFLAPVVLVIVAVLVFLAARGSMG